MLSMFSPFDYAFYCFSPYFYLMFYVFLMHIYYFFNYLSYFLLKLLEFFSTFFFSLGLDSNRFKGLFYLHISLFLYLFLLNFSSILSFNFSSTAQASTVFVLSFSFWFGSLFFNFVKNFGGFLAHLTPSGTPMYLATFMVLIELVSTIIRPLTLTIRLVANILCGHLLMILLCGLVLSIPYVFIVYLMLNLVEIFVSLIQSYIFSTLVVLYLSDFV